MSEILAHETPDIATTNWESDTEIWEHQGRPLTAGQLGLGGDEFASVPVRVAIYDGIGDTPALYDPVEIGYTGIGETPGGRRHHGDRISM